MSTINFSNCYKNRFSQKERIKKNIMWRVLCIFYFQKYISKKDTVIDLGAGYCEFINNIACARKIALDINPDTKRVANKNVEVINKNIFELPKKFDNSIDVVFLSNFLEHLNTKDEILEVLTKVYKLLKSNGKIILLQPNIDLVKEAYWDFIDHKVALNTKSMREVLEITGFKINVFIRKFLPYTTKNINIPMMPTLLKIYLLLPEIIKPFAGQTFVVAVKNHHEK